MIAFAIVLVIFVFWGWFVVRVATINGGGHGGGPNILDGFALTLVIFIIGMSLWFHTGI